ncbi:MAG TPA: 3-deoxy-manno-octulosonate cytidylyltransferase [Oligoflexus sp.]|uniref:3-deoxy-manno-octulosonate cytidylyltransferase n=1 Tax=Oligoflexus sp. TaxID=1971216 RepID=UPI002D21F06D|nr:3-deoxy-manno-octulosonate cytidylyltransferase [Oligoflexus sp.]HYX37878.1 3-deoxy-manno-octulosonate cytidylyltransferase [Oligoflexus sp.]
MIWNNWLIVIPARLSSTRLPQKPLADLCGKPLVVRVYERLKPLANKGADVVVATDSQLVMDACLQHQIPSVMTDAAHQSGTDRCAEVARQRPKPFILNVQGDEPFIHCGDLEALARLMIQTGVGMGTMMHRNSQKADYENPNCVKVVVNAAHQALYFSRSPLPHYRAPQTFQNFWQHLGVYAFSADTLQNFCSLAQHPLELAESLEQLRALGHNIPIVVSIADHPAIGIDTPEDLEAARARFSTLT